jgi:hypothetical protein
MNKEDNDKKDKATVKNCSIKRECLQYEKEEKKRRKFLTKTPHTANMLFSWKIDQKKKKKKRKVYIVYTKQKRKGSFF